MKQSEATVNAIMAVCDDKGYSHVKYETIYKSILTKEDVNVVVDKVTSGVLSGDVDMTEKARSKMEDDKAVRRYVVGLVNDRLRKAKVLNGNTDYEYANPGKIKNGKDEQLSTMVELQKLHANDSEEYSILQDAIEARREELKPKKQVKIDVDALPPELRAKLGL